MKCFLLLLTFGFLVAEVASSKLELEEAKLWFKAFLAYKGKMRYTALEGLYYNATIENPEAFFESGPAIIRDLTLKCRRAKVSGTVIQTFTAECDNLNFDADGFSFETGHIKGKKSRAVLKKAAWLYFGFDGEEFVGDDIGPQNKPDINALRERAGSFGRFIGESHENKGNMTLNLTCKEAKIENFKGVEITLEKGELRLETGSIDHKMIVKEGNVTVEKVQFNAEMIFTKSDGVLTVLDRTLSDAQKAAIRKKVENAEINFYQEPVFPAKLPTLLSSMKPNNEKPKGLSNL